MHIHFLILLTFHCSAPYNNSWQPRPVLQGGGDGLSAVSGDRDPPATGHLGEAGWIPPLQLRYPE